MINFEKYILSDSATILDALKALNKLSNDVLTLFVVNEQGQMIGTLTDGDIRRKLIEGYGVNENVVSAINPNFHFIDESKIDIEKIREFKAKYITLVPSLDSNRRIIRIYNFKKQVSLLPIDAVLMAGGKGERLRPLTEYTPKPLLKVGGKSIIDYNVDRLISFGIENISVTVNYLKEQLEAHFEATRDGVHVKCVQEPEFLGTIGSINYVKTFRNDTVLVMNSDLFTNIDYEEFYLDFLMSNADMSVAAIPYSVNVPYGIFETAGSTIQAVKEKPTYNYYANAGIYLVKRSLLELIPKDTFFNATDFMELLIQKNCHVVRFPLTGYWIDIGKHEDFKKAQELVQHL